MAVFIRRLRVIGFAILAWIVASPVGAVTVTETTVADFNAGTPEGCYVGEAADGEVLLTPTEGTEFFGSTLPSDWLLRDWNPPNGLNTTNVAAGLLTDNSARINPDPLSGPAPYGPPRSLEFVATFGAQAFQHVGFGGGDQTGGNEVYNGPPWAMFSTGNQTANVLARVHNGSTLSEVAVAVIDGNLHRYRIDWSATQVDFSIDGVLAQTDSTNLITANMRPAASDFSDALPALTVDWIRMTPFGSPCSYDSNVIDSGATGTEWTTLVATTGVPPLTAVSLETRTGDTTTPDGSWSAFDPVVGVTIASPGGRYLQYRATLSTTDPDQTPELQQVEVSFNLATPTASPTFTLPPTPTDTPLPPTPTETPTAMPGSCGNANVDPGEQCDDGNTDNGDCCSSTCQFEPSGSSCNDRSTCTSGDTCNGIGMCTGFTSCNTTLTCNFCGSKCTLNAGVCKCG